MATPIGNLRDLTLRARDVLAAVDRIVCEDTRVTGKLVHGLGLKKPLQAYHEHNAERVRPQLLQALDAGAALALVSDAGTPLVSDPGFKLVREVRGAGHAVVPVPGPSAVLAALTGAGLPTDRFFFQGFLPAKATAKARAIDELAHVPATLVLFESAARVAATLALLAERLGPREAVLARELTKLYEEFRHGTLDELAQLCRDSPPRGEIALVVAGPDASTPAWSDDEVVRALEAALALGSPSAAARDVAEASGRSRRELYARALALKAR